MLSARATEGVGLCRPFSLRHSCPTLVAPWTKRKRVARWLFWQSGGPDEVAFSKMVALYELHRVFSY